MKTNLKFIPLILLINSCATVGNTTTHNDTSCDRPIELFLSSGKTLRCADGTLQADGLVMYNCADQQNRIFKDLIVNLATISYVYASEGCDTEFSLLPNK